MACAFYPEHLDRLALMSGREIAFVVRHAGPLHDSGLPPAAMMDAARLAPRKRDFVARRAPALCSLGLSAHQIIEVARLAPARRAFVLSYGAMLAQIGFAPPQMVWIAGYRSSARQYIVDHGMSLLNEGYSRWEIVRQARHPSQRPERRPERLIEWAPQASTPAANDEVLQLDELSPQITERLARCSEAARVYVSVHGPALRQAGLDIEEIVALAESEHPVAGAGLAPPVRQPPNQAPLYREELRLLAHARQRWAVTQARLRHDPDGAFYRDTVPAALVRLLLGQRGQPDSGYRNLHLLLAGLAHAEDNYHRSTAAGHRERVQTLTDYLASRSDKELLEQCDNAAAEAVTHCGDRVAYGLARVEQVVTQRRMERGELMPHALFDSIEAMFLQPRVENIAAHLANARKLREEGYAPRDALDSAENFARHVADAGAALFQRADENAGEDVVPGMPGAFPEEPPARAFTPDYSASESLEMYAALVPLLRRNGVRLIDSARTSSYASDVYGNLERVEVDYALNEIERHVRDLSVDFLHEFEGNAAVEHVLKRRFQPEYREMCETRESLGEAADDAMFNQAADADSLEEARQILTELGSMESDWYRDKLKIVLKNHRLLDDLPELAPDLDDR